MALIDSYLNELDLEAQTTRRVLERVPAAKLGWAPHAKSMKLGQLALHVAMLPGAIAEVATLSSFQRPDFNHPSAASAAELLPALEQSVAKAHDILGKMDDATLMSTWRLVDGDKEIAALPRAAVLRTLMRYHHRGQLSVYLRELDVPVPSIYGPSADENPFA
jgi:uncharacterized damage-inducible protein DinB